MKKKRILPIFLLMLSMLALTFQMNQPTLAMEFEDYAQTQNGTEITESPDELLTEEVEDENVNEGVSESEAAADDTTEGLTEGLYLPMMKQRGGDPYVITNDADSAERYVMSNFTELDAKITELAANNKAYTLTLNKDLEVTGDNSLVFRGPSKWTVQGNGNTVKKEEGAPVNLNRVFAI